jgi:hypothetical protein
VYLFNSSYIILWKMYRTGRNGCRTGKQKHRTRKEEEQVEKEEWEVKKEESGMEG